MKDHNEVIIVVDFGGQKTQNIAREIRRLGVYSEIVPFYKAGEVIERLQPRGIVLADRAVGAQTGSQPILHQSGITDEEPKPKRESWHETESKLTFPDDVPQLNMNEHDKESSEHSDHMLRKFLFETCQCRGDWTTEAFIERQVEEIRQQVGERKVLCALSGGVDSSVVALLIHKAIGDQLTCMFIDHNLLRKGEAESVMETFVDKFAMDVVKIDARERFMSHLAGVEDPEQKRKVIGEQFIRVFEEESAKLGSFDFLAQGTLYSDIIESISATGQTIKSHHNVGGLPEHMTFELIEPLQTLFKDEVREVGLACGLPADIVWRQPFPGPGLAIRVIGEVTEEKLAIVREADAILREEVAKAGLERDIWQYFAALPNMKSVGVTDGKRTYSYTVGIRAITSVDGMTAHWAKIPYDILDKISTRITSEVKQVNRVVYDITSKPPATVEWE